MTNFFTISHASRAAQVAEDTVRYAVKRGQLAVSARTEGGTALFTRADLDAWIERRKGAKEARQSHGAAA